MSAFVEYTVPVWRGLNMRALKVDQAYMVLESFYHDVVYLYSLSEECYKCPYSRVKSVHPRSTSHVLSTHDSAVSIGVSRPLKFKIFDADLGPYAYPNSTALCEVHNDDLKEFGVYNLTLDVNGSCALVTDKAGVDVNLSILSVFLLVALSLAIIKMSWCAWRSYHFVEHTEPVVAPVPSAPSTPTVQRRRLRSLDAFRGLAIVLMIFVNSGGGGYWWIEHATWNGLHLADVVFPSFLWIMGVCIPISVKSQLVRGTSKLKICRKILWRSLKLFFIGLCLNSINGPQLEQLRIMGVLQRFGIAYFLCSSLHVVFSTAEQVLLPQTNWKRIVFELTLLKGEIVAIVVLVILHLSIVFGLPVPGCPTGYLGPGGAHDNNAYPECVGGATGFIDRQILGEAHIYKYPTASHVYDSPAFDPEGVFGCVLTTVQVLFGVIAGSLILMYNDACGRITRWLLWALCLGLLGGILCLFSKEVGFIPLNKNLWSLSFVFVTTAIAFVVLALLYYIIDVSGWYNGFPFVQAGMNAIIMYVGHTIMHKMLPWHWHIGTMNTHFVLLLESVWNTLLWIVIALYLDCKKFYYTL